MRVRAAEGDVPGRVVVEKILQRKTEEAGSCDLGDDDEEIEHPIITPIFPGFNHMNMPLGLITSISGYAINISMTFISNIRVLVRYNN
jgi:hypothetical protein